MTRTRAAIYARISQDRTGAGLGVDRQISDCRELADRLGWTVIDEYADNDVSAYSGRPREQYERMLADITNGHVDAVIAWHADRLHRSPTELERYITVCEPRTVPTHTVKAGTLDLSTASGRMTARIVGAVARGESEQKSERLRRQRKQAQADGKWIGGRRPFGYEADGYTVHSVEGPAVAAAANRILAGDSLRAICREWNEAGMTTTSGSKWTTTSLAQMLARPRNAGLVGNRQRGKRVSSIVGDAKWQPLIDRDIWTALVAKLSDPSRRTNRGVSRRLVGSGIYRCGECGAPMRSGGQGARGQDRYMCTAQNACTRRAAAPIDEYVREVIAAVLRRDGVRLLPPEVDLSPQRARLVALRARSEEIASEYAALNLTGAQFRAANERLSGEIEALEAEIARRAGGSSLSGIADAEDAGVAFLEADPDRQRAIIADLADVRIFKVGAGKRGFDPSSVEVTPKAR